MVVCDGGYLGVDQISGCAICTPSRSRRKMARYAGHGFDEVADEDDLAVYCALPSSLLGWAAVFFCSSELTQLR